MVPILNSVILVAFLGNCPGREDKSTNKYKVPCEKDYGKWGWVVECLHA